MLTDRDAQLDAEDTSGQPSFLILGPTAKTIDLNPTDNGGKTPLQLAIESGHHDIEDQLLYSSYYDKP
jgi:ankyrin repeat protein